MEGDNNNGENGREDTGDHGSAPTSTPSSSEPPVSKQDGDRNDDRGRDNRGARDRGRDDRGRDRERDRGRDPRDNRGRDWGRDGRDVRGGRDGRDGRDRRGNRRSRSRSPRGSTTTRVNRRGSSPRKSSSSSSSSSSTNKRRSRSRSKTPPPRKRSSLWDQAPTGSEPTVLGISTLPGQGGLLNPNVDRQSRRLYVGNIPTGITETEIQEFFNTAMVASKAITKAGNPVISVQINVEKSYAFLEMRSHDEATAGMVFDGIMLHGNALKVRRPKDYVQPVVETPVPKPALPVGAIVATNVPDSQFKIFIGGLPGHLTEEQVKELLMTFGPLKAFNLVKDTSTGLSKGFAFCEYLDDSMTDKACAGLNGMKLGDKQLLVQRASIGAKHTPAALPPPQASTVIPTGPLTPATILNLSIPAVTLISTLPQVANIKSRVLMLVNLVTIDELRDEDEYAGVLIDVREECEKIGPVVSVTIPRPPPLPVVEEKSIFDGPIEMPPPPAVPTEKVCPIARVYVEFEKQEDCLRALNGLAGRRYGGHYIVTSLYSQELYEAGRVI